MHVLPKFGNGILSITSILFLTAVVLAQGTTVQASSEDNSEIGVFRNGVWFLDFNGNQQWDGCETDRCISFGLAEDVPVVLDQPKDEPSALLYPGPKFDVGDNPISVAVDDLNATASPTSSPLIRTVSQTCRVLWMKCTE